MKEVSVKRFSAVLLAIAMLSGCGSEAAEASGSSSAAVGTSASEETAGTNEIFGTAGGEVINPNDGTVTIGVSQIVTGGLTPLRTTQDVMYDYSILLYERLMYLNADGEYVPWVLKDYTAGDDGLTYDFEIYDNVYDSEGNHITAEDIVFDIQKNIETNMKPDFGKIESVTATGDYTVNIVFKQDMIYLFQSTMWNTNVFSKAAFEASEDEMVSDPVSTSHYKLTEYTPDSSMTYERRDDYWQTDPSLIPAGLEANTKTIKFMAIPEVSQRVIALETGTIDEAVRIDAGTAAPYLEDDNYLYETMVDKEGITLFFSGHESRPVANDENLRKAICYALDANAFVQGICLGHGEIMHDACSSSGMGYNPKWDSEPYFDYDPELAKEYLEKSDYEGQELEILTVSTFQRQCEIIQSYCEAVGIKVKINVVDKALASQLRLDGSAYDLFLWKISTPSLAYNWSIRYDDTAYSTGDATSRHDDVLTQMLYETWTNEGYTEENIDKIHYYLMDHAYSYGLYKPYDYLLIRKDSGLTNAVNAYIGYLAPWASCYDNY